MLPAGAYIERVRFERRETVHDGAGNERGEWRPITTVWAAFRAVHGREAVQAAQLESTMRGTLTVRRSSVTAGITAEAKVVFVSGPYAPKQMQIRSIIPTSDRAEIEMVLEEVTAL